MIEISDKMAWAKNQEWFKAMENCIQDPNWHQEGNVGLHTEMVYNALSRVVGWSALSEKEKDILEWAAIFHDIAKPKTTCKGEDGKIHSPHHSENGRRMARWIMCDDLGLDFKTRETICNLIRYHSRPIRLDTCIDSQCYVVDTSCLVPNHLLYILSYADTLGRISSNVNEGLGWIDYWKELCIQNDCFDKPYPFINSEARFLFYNTPRQEEFSFHYTPFPKDFEVVMMCAIPGTGKTTYATKYFSNYPIIEMDEIRKRLGIRPGRDTSGAALQEAKETAKKYLRIYEPFVLSCTNVFRSMRERWIRLFDDYNARIKIIYMEKPINVVLEQNKKREAVVPEKIILKMRSAMDIPELSECHVRMDLV